MPGLNRFLTEPHKSWTHEEPHGEGQAGDDYLWIVYSELVNKLEDVMFV